MSNKEKYIQVFINSFAVKEKDLVTLKYQGVGTWDSMGHMRMIAELEETFNVMIEMEDILDFNSYAKGIDIVKKYGIEL
ncbi:MAG: acyl carrier protein [Bacteroidetes bacterium]|jgi:acyl carrier protein|nr:acyl carrier protein [Bacteroidota bacterium]